MNPPGRLLPSRWFLSWVAGLMVLLFLALMLAALLLMRQGFILREGIVVGSSMEPILQGPRYRTECENCFLPYEFSLDTCQQGKHTVCPNCGRLSAEVVSHQDAFITPGEAIHYAPLRMVRSKRSIDIREGNVHASGLQRNNIVVLGETPGTFKEVKRLVGLPGESISIKYGDLFVNDERICKKLDQAIRQSISVYLWERDTKLEAKNSSQWICNGQRFSIGHIAEMPVQFVYKSGIPMDNRLDRNAHDSHKILPVEDFGIAMRFSKIPENGRLQCVFRSPGSECSIRLQFTMDDVLVESDGRQERLALESVLPSNGLETRTGWFVVGRIDGHLLAGNPFFEVFRNPIRQSAMDPVIGANTSNDATDEREAFYPIEMVATEGVFEVDTLIVFRDIHYRGQDDAEIQEWNAENGVVLLGDNVSASIDSRQRWRQRPPIQLIKGVVIEANNPLENLFNQNRFVQPRGR